MTVVGTVEVIESAIFLQGDVRDPLGIWGFRSRLVGDGGGGGMKLTAEVAASKRSAYVYTLYQAQAAQVVGVPATDICKLRILTNWPNIDPQADVQAYGSLKIITWAGAVDLTVPDAGPFDQSLVDPQDRFLLIYDPRASGDAMAIVEMVVGKNVSGDEISFEGYGYFWDRSVMQAPGGPRHPGAS